METPGIPAGMENTGFASRSGLRRFPEPIGFSRALFQTQNRAGIDGGFLLRRTASFFAFRSALFPPPSAYGMQGSPESPLFPAFAGSARFSFLRRAASRFLSSGSSSGFRFPEYALARIPTFRRFPHADLSRLAGYPGEETVFPAPFSGQNLFLREGNTPTVRFPSHPVTGSFLSPYASFSGGTRAFSRPIPTGQRGEEGLPLDGTGSPGRKTAPAAERTWPSGGAFGYGRFLEGTPRSAIPTLPSFGSQGFPGAWIWALAPGSRRGERGEPGPVRFLFPGTFRSEIPLSPEEMATHPAVFSALARLAAGLPNLSGLSPNRRFRNGERAFPAADAGGFQAEFRFKPEGAVAGLPVYRSTLLGRLRGFTRLFTGAKGETRAPFASGNGYRFLRRLPMPAFFPSDPRHPGREGTVVPHFPAQTAQTFLSPASALPAVQTRSPFLSRETVTPSGIRTVLPGTLSAAITSTSFSGKGLPSFREPYETAFDPGFLRLPPGPEIRAPFPVRESGFDDSSLPFSREESRAFPSFPQVPGAPSPAGFQTPPPEHRSFPPAQPLPREEGTALPSGGAFPYGEPSGRGSATGVPSPLPGVAPVVRVHRHLHVHHHQARHVHRHYHALYRPALHRRFTARLSIYRFGFNTPAKKKLTWWQQIKRFAKRVGRGVLKAGRWVGRNLLKAGKFVGRNLMKAGRFVGSKLLRGGKWAAGKLSSAGKAVGRGLKTAVGVVGKGLSTVGSALASGAKGAVGFFKRLGGRLFGSRKEKKEKASPTVLGKEAQKGGFFGRFLGFFRKGEEGEESSKGEKETPSLPASLARSGVAAALKAAARLKKALVPGEEESGGVPEKSAGQEKPGLFARIKGFVKKAATGVARGVKTVAGSIAKGAGSLWKRAKSFGSSLLSRFKSGAPKTAVSENGTSALRFAAARKRRYQNGALLPEGAEPPEMATILRKEPPAAEAETATEEAGRSSSESTGEIPADPLKAMEARMDDLALKIFRQLKNEAELELLRRGRL